MRIAARLTTPAQLAAAQMEVDVATMWVRPAAFNHSTLIPGITVLSGTVLVLILTTLPNRSAVQSSRDEALFTRCPTSVEGDLLSPRALQCELDAPNGRWRTLSRVWAHGALVVEVEAAVVDDAEEIARRFVIDRGGRFSEVLVYVQPERAVPPMLIRRIRWTQATGFEQVEFTGPPAR